MENIIITGANRGIGFHLVQQFLENTDSRIFATCRQPAHAEALNTLQTQNDDRLVIIALDVLDADSIQRASNAITEHTESIDLLINNAGIFPKTSESQDFGELTHEAMMPVMMTNSVAPVIVTQAFSDMLKQGDNSRVVMISSGMGSINRLQSSNSYSYRMSKTAVNMASRLISFELASHVTTVTMHPGWVQTDMGGESAALTPTESASLLFNVITQLSPDDNGAYLNYDGTAIGW